VAKVTTRAVVRVEKCMIKMGGCVCGRREGFDGGFSVDYDGCARGSGCSACESWSVDDPKLMVDS